MGRISQIEHMASSGLPRYNNLRLVLRGRPRFLDPQLDGGNLRFAIKRGFNFSALMPDNQSEIAEDVHKDTTTIVMKARPSPMKINTLIRLGNSEAIGEMHIVRDTIDTTTVEVFEPIITNYSSSPDQNAIPVVSLLGTPCNVYAPVVPPFDKKIMTIDSWYKLVPSDVLLMSATPDILESLQEYTIKRADFFGTRAGNTGIGEPTTVYLYHIELATKTGLLPFIPTVGLRLYLKPLPLYFRDGWGTGNIEIPDDVGPCVLDAFYGSLLDTNVVGTKLGIQTFDSFGDQTNVSLTGNQQWQEISSNHLIVERPISSDSLLFWQRITGNFQYQKKGYFLAELTSDGKFSFSSNLLVPKWPTDREYGWVIPLFSRSAVRCIVQFEPQPQQVFEIPSNALTYIRPHVKIIYNNIMTGSIPLISAGDYIITSDIDFTADATTDVCTTNVNHGFTTGNKIQVTTTGVLPSGLLPMTDYYVIVDSATSFKLSDTWEHARDGLGVINIIDSGSGLHRCSNPNVNFITSGVKEGQFFSNSVLKWKIANVTSNTFTLVEGIYPVTANGVAFEILEQDLTPIDRILISFKGSPNSRVEIRDWQYDGTLIASLSYYILGTNEAYGQKRWLAGGFSVKPLFYNLAVLRARYSDGVSRYNAGHIYT